MDQPLTPDPPVEPSGGRGVGAGIALIFMTPVVLVFGVFLAYAGAVKCGNTAPNQTCQGYSGWGSGWGYSVAVALPAVLGIASLVARRRWAGAPFVCWCITIVAVPVLIVIG